MLRVLASVYACEPGKGSEPGIGWNYVRQIARFHEVWVLTRANNRVAIGRALTQDPLPNVHWVYFDLPRWLSFWKKGRRGLYAYYYLWQFGAYWLSRKLYRQIRFDLVHHVTLGTYWVPSLLAMLPAPFVWGPVGGGESAPSSFWHCFSVRGMAFEVLRDFARALSGLDPFVRITARRAALALSNTPDTGRLVQGLGCRNIVVFSHDGLPQDEIQRLSNTSSRPRSSFRVMSMGKLLHWKGFELGLKAFAHFHSQFSASEYWVFGDGPERKRLEGLAEKLGLKDSVSFRGAVPRSQVLESLGKCDVVLHPSLHDSCGGVCVEAMAAGCPVVCLDLGGPGLQVTEETGIKVPAVSPEQAIRDLAAALRRLADDPVLLASLGDAGRQQVVRHFGWDRRGEFLMEVYAKVTPTAVRSLC